METILFKPSIILLIASWLSILVLVFLSFCARVGVKAVRTARVLTLSSSGCACLFWGLIQMGSFAPQFSANDVCLSIQATISIAAGLALLFSIFRESKTADAKMRNWLGGANLAMFAVSFTTAFLIALDPHLLAVLLSMAMLLNSLFSLTAAVGLILANAIDRKG